jgi:hypothetical protein
MDFVMLSAASTDQRGARRFTAPELIRSAAKRGGTVEFARVATPRVLNRHPERVLNPEIDPYCGRRKLKRDE